ncbi:nucleotidyltransferase domain-containing protein [Nocardia sp. NBC_00511]|uniref:nucleotidyltransferase domain-containing protein n=1 Tax=Nocardia sp. NBC_00511 TaxID=2903591 RepID=UPI002F907FB8
MNHPEPLIAARTVDLAVAVFGANLLAAYVGGSYARATHKPTSDVDTVVILEKPDRDAERTYADGFRALHESAGLAFAHCGEIFDEATLTGLLDFTDMCLAAVPSIQHSACYLADCPLSSFRKGDVVYKMLQDPKICVYDPQEILGPLTARALDYFQRWPMPRVQPYKHALQLPAHSEQARLASKWDQRRRARDWDWTATPIGVGLERWFGPGLSYRSPAFHGREPVTTVAPGAPNVCPLPVVDGQLADLLRAQCLAMPAPGHDGSRR